MGDEERSVAWMEKEAEATRAADGFRDGELRLDYDTAGRVPLPPRPDSEPMVTSRSRRLNSPATLTRRRHSTHHLR